MKKKNSFTETLKLLPVCWQNICIDFGSKFGDIDSALGQATFLVNLAMTLAGLVAVIVLIYGGITFITAGGDPEKIEKGNTTILSAIAGLVVILIARLIIVFVLEKVIGA